MKDDASAPASPPSHGLIVGAKRAFLAYVVAWLLVLLPMAWRDEGYDALVGLPIVLAWLTGPAFVTYFFVKASRTRRGQWTFLATLCAVFASMTAMLPYVVLVSEDPKAGLAVMAFAFWQYCGLAVFALLARLGGWRARDGWR